MLHLENFDQPCVACSRSAWSKTIFERNVVRGLKLGVGRSVVSTRRSLRRTEIDIKRVDLWSSALKREGHGR